MLKLSLVVFPVRHPQGVSNLIPVWVAVSSFSSLPPLPLASNSFYIITQILYFSSFSSSAFAFAGAGSCSVVGAHRISPLPCQCQQTSTCLQMRKNSERRCERKEVAQQMWITDMGQRGDIAGHLKISSYIRIHTETQSAVNMSTDTYAHTSALLVVYSNSHTTQRK